MCPKHLAASEGRIRRKEETAGTTLLAGAGRLAVALGLAMPAVATAQLQPGRTHDDRVLDATPDDIIVLGVRRSDLASIKSKRDADQIVEVITAEDLGQLPDRSIVDSLETLAGVTGNRDRGRSNQVEVRGLGGDFTMVTLDNRVAANSFGARAVNVDLYPSEFIQRGLVYKTPTPDQIEGGIGGTVELQTAKAFDLNRTFLTATARGLYNPSSRNIRGENGLGRRISAAFADTFADDRIGVFLSAATVSEPVMVQNVTFGEASIGDYCGSGPYCANAPYTGPDGLGGDYYYLGDITGDGKDDPIREYWFASAQGLVQKRDSIAGNIQFRATPEWTLTVDGLYSRNTSNGNWAGIVVVPDGTPYQFSNVTQNATGVVGYTNANTNLEFFSAQQRDRGDASRLGFNSRYQGNGWTWDIDISYSEANRNFRYLEARPGGYRVADVVGLNYTEKPGDFLPNGSFGVDITNPANIAQGERTVRTLREQNRERTKETIWAAATNLSREFEDSFLTRLTVGARYSVRDKTRDRIPVIAYGLAAGASFPTVAATAGQFPFKNGWSEFDSDLLRKGFVYLDIGKISAAFGAQPAYQPTQADRAFYYDISEKTTAGFIRADFETAIGGVDIRGNAGLRVVHTDLRSNGAIAQANISYNPATNEFRVVSLNSNVFNPVNARNKFTDWLPSLNLTANLSRDVLMRLGAGRAMVRPNFDTLRANVEVPGQGSVVRGGSPIGAAGNPLLDPIRAWQADVSFEWYPTEGVYLSAGAFYKNLDGVYETAVVRATNLTVTSTNPAVPVPAVLTRGIDKTDKNVEMTGIELSGRVEFRNAPGLLGKLFAYGNLTAIDFHGAGLDYKFYDDPANTSGNPAKDRPAFRAFYLPRDFVKTSYTLGAGYDDGRLETRVFYSRQSSRIQQDQFDRLRRPDGDLNVTMRYNLNSSIAFFLSGSNLTGQRQESGDLNTFGTVPANIDRDIEAYATGRSFQFGVTVRS